MRPNKTLGWTATGAALLVAGWFLQTPLAAAKPAPPPPNLSCTLTFDDTLTYTDPVTLQVHTIPTMVQSDGQGAYVDGVDSACYVIEGLNSGNYQNLYANPGTRYWWMPGQLAITPYTRAGYTDFEDSPPAYFDITDIDTVKTLGLTERRRIRVGVGYFISLNKNQGAIMFGDSLSSDPFQAGSSSAWVTPLTLNSAGTSACSWRIRFYPYAAVEAGDTGAIAGTRYVALREGNSEKFYVRTADFALPLSATARIKAGVNGCS